VSGLAGAGPALGVLFALVLATPVAAFELDAEEREALAEGKMLVQRREPTGGKGVSFRVLRVLASPVERVWPVVRDCGLFHEFMPRVRESESQPGSTEEVTLCRVVISSAPIGELRSTVRSQVEPVGEGWRRHWQLVEGDFGHSRGAWTVVPWRGGGSLLVYEVDASPKVPVPASVLALAQRLQLPAMFDAIDRRAALASSLAPPSADAAHVD